MDNYDFIKNKFDNDGLEVPSNISEDVIAEKLADKPKLKLHQKPAFKKAVSLVACFVFLIGIVSAARPEAVQPLIENGNESVITSVKIKSFDSYEQIADKIENTPHAELYYTGSSDGSNDTGGRFDLVSGSASYAETYKQVEGVDEGDIIKNDGKHIFYVNNNNEVLIYEGEKLVSKITDYIYDRAGDDFYDTDYCSIEELYIYGNHLIIIQVSHYADDRAVLTSKINIHIYDVSDINNPKKIKTFSQSGDYPKTRMIGSQLYVISNVYNYGAEKAEDLYMYTEDDGVENVIPAESVSYCDGTSDTPFLIIGAIDTEKMERSADTKAFFGGSSTVYCNENNLYMVLYNFNYSNNSSTGIVKFQLEANEINVSDAVEINGYVHNQFSLDENNGYLRIATTDENGNNLYVFDDTFNKVGEVTGIAKGERIEAARYIGDMCYLITYEQTDPLFVIDVSDPTTPVVKGSVEVTGFSSQLHPVDEDTIVGIGYSDDMGIKLVLFDISNASKPKVLDTYTLDGDYAHSNAQNNHKAIVVDNEKNYIAIDYFCYNESGFNVDTGALVFNAEKGRINIIDKLNVKCADEANNIERITYIGDTLYAFDIDGNIYSFDM